MKKIFLPLFLLFLLVLSIASLPTILSTAPEKKIFLFLASKKLHQEITAEKLHCSWFGPQTMNTIEIKSENFTLSIEELFTDLPFWKLSSLSSFSKKAFTSLKAKTSVKNATVTTLIPESHFSHINLSVTHEETQPFHLLMTGENDEGGAISLDALFEDLDFSKTSFSLSCKDLPSLFLDRLAPLFVKLPNTFFSTLLGKTIQLKGSGNIENKMGSLDLFLSSPLVSAKMQGDVQEGVITLHEDLQCAIFLTETFSRYFLKEVSPLFISAASSQNPIHLTLFKEGFELPIDPFSLKEVKVQKAILDLGKMRAKNADGLALIMGILKLHLPSHIDEMDVWTTPITLSLYDGTLYTDRMDALLDNSLHICTWGTIDLVTQEVDMTLGLTADTLYETFRFSNLPEDYVMTIPVKGTINNIQIDNSIATAKIAKLMALKATDAGVLSKLFGSVVQEENIPPPKRPFPWEGKTKKSSTEKQSPENFLDLFH